MCIMKIAKIEIPNLRNVYYKIVCPKCKNINKICSNDIIDIYIEKTKFKYENYYSIRDHEFGTNNNYFIDKEMINKTYENELKT